MPRYIDADRFEAVGTTIPEDMDSISYIEGMRFVLEKIDNTPTLDVVEVVRCEDCIYYETYYHCCKRHGHYVGMPCDGYCSLGERMSV